MPSFVIKPRNLTCRAQLELPSMPLVLQHLPNPRQQQQQQQQAAA